MYIHNKLQHGLKPLIGLAATLIVLLFACDSSSNSSKQTAEAENVDTLAYTNQTYRLESNLEKKPGDTIKERTYFQAVYPVFEDADLNAYVESSMVMNSIPDIEYKTLKESGEGFIRMFDEYQRAEYSSPWPWYNNIHVKVLQINPHYISFAVEYDDFMGGAHGNHGTNYGNYDLELRREITLADIIEEGKMDSLTKIAEQIFIEQEQMNEQESAFTDYFFEDDVFALNDNFLLQDSSILFLYNIYEIKAYAAGTTKLEIPYAKINSLLSSRAKEILNQ